MLDHVSKSSLINQIFSTASLKQYVVGPIKIWAKGLGLKLEGRDKGLGFRV